MDLGKHGPREGRRGGHFERAVRRDRTEFFETLIAISWDIDRIKLD